jgi:hypothetical protein
MYPDRQAFYAESSICQGLLEPLVDKCTVYNLRSKGCAFIFSVNNTCYGIKSILVFLKH